MAGTLYALLLLGCSYAVQSQVMEAWVTTGDEAKLLQREPNIPASSTPGTASNIEVRTANKNQFIKGFGAAFTNSASYLIWNSPQRAEILDHLFDPDTGAGLSYVRLVMGGSDFNAVDPYTYNDIPVDETDFNQLRFSIDPDRDFVLPLIKEVVSKYPDVRIMASPWSAPAWMKTTRSLFGGTLVNDNRYKEALAEYFIKFLQAYQAEGVHIDTLSIQNEPGHSDTGYPTMSMTSQLQTEVVIHLGGKLEFYNIDTGILVLDHNWDMTDYVLDVYSDVQALLHAAGSAWHCYGGNPSDPSIVRNAYPNKDIYFTECSGGEWDTDFGSSLGWNTETLLMGQTAEGARTVLLWNLALDPDHGPRQGVTSGCSDCRGVMTVLPGGGYSSNVEYYSLGQFSKFVRPGAQHMDTSAGGTFRASAFENTDGSIVVVVMNWDWSSSSDFEVHLDGLYYKYTGLPPRSVISMVQRP